MKIVCLALLSVLLLASCRTSNKPKESYPADIHAACVDAKNGSRACIEGVSGQMKNVPVVKIVKRPGEQKIGGIWCWYDPSWKSMVGGLTHKKGSSYMCEIGADPKTGKVDPRVISHEFAHCWLWHNKGITDHPAQYKKCFYNWMDIRGTNSFSVVHVVDGDTETIIHVFNEQ